jgi:hypothetical protein
LCYIRCLERSSLAWRMDCCNCWWQKERSVWAYPFGECFCKFAQNLIFINQALNFIGYVILKSSFVGFECVFCCMIRNKCRWLVYQLHVDFCKMFFQMMWIKTDISCIFNWPISFKCLAVCIRDHKLWGEFYFLWSPYVLFCCRGQKFTYGWHFCLQCSFYIFQVTETGVEVLTGRLPTSPNVFPWLNP